MKRIFRKEFWNTPIIEGAGSGKPMVVLILFVIFMICVIVAGVAAWRIIY